MQPQAALCKVWCPHDQRQCACVLPLPILDSLILKPLSGYHSTGKERRTSLQREKWMQRIRVHLWQKLPYRGCPSVGNWPKQREKYPMCGGGPEWTVTAREGWEFIQGRGQKQWWDTGHMRQSDWITALGIMKYRILSKRKRSYKPRVLVGMCGIPCTYIDTKIT